MFFLKGHRRPRPSRIALFVLLVCCVWIFTSNQLLSLIPGGGGSDNGFAASSSNSTLGFGRIYVISKQGSPRRKGIIQAANVTGLQLSIPVQPIWTEDDERNFRLPEDSSIAKGSLLAWLGHIHALQQYDISSLFSFARIGAA